MEKAHLELPAGKGGVGAGVTDDFDDAADGPGLDRLAPVFQQSLVDEFGRNGPQRLEQTGALRLRAQLGIQGLEAAKELSFRDCVAWGPGQGLAELEHRAGRRLARRSQSRHIWSA